MGDTRHTRPEIIRESIVDKRIGFTVVTVKSAVGTHPQVALIVAKQVYNGIVTQRRLICFIVEIRSKLIAIKFIQAIVRSNPQVPILILTQISNETIGKQVSRYKFSRLS